VGFPQQAAQAETVSASPPPELAVWNEITAFVHGRRLQAEQRARDQHYQQSTTIREQGNAGNVARRTGSGHGRAAGSSCCPVV
jgi:hypothetical protein